LFVVGDIHGQIDHLTKLLDKISPKLNDVLIFVGDYIDRGKDPKAVVNTIINLKKHCKVIALMGNHEAMLLDYLNNPQKDSDYLLPCNGANKTSLSYKGGIPQEHLDFFSNLVTCYENKEYFIVHAGVPDKPLEEINEDDMDDLLWVRDSFLNSNYKWDKIIVHGHTPIKKVFISDKRINVDTGCVFGGKLSAIELPSLKIFQS